MVLGKCIYLNDLPVSVGIPIKPINHYSIYPKYVVNIMNFIS